MTKKELLKNCEKAYDEGDFKKLIELCDEVLTNDENNQIATGYKAIAYYYLSQPKKALEILTDACALYPKNHYYKNILAMVYYDIGDYEKSLECCEEGLKIKDFDWLVENKIKALIKLNRIEEALKCYENVNFYIPFIDFLTDAGKYSEALKYCLDDDCGDFESVVDKIKEKNTSQIGDYYLSWIYDIKSKNDTKTCRECGGELIPIVWGFPGPEIMEKSARGEVHLGGCCIFPFKPNYHCKKCSKDFNLGFEGLNIECRDYKLRKYIEYKIEELISNLREKSMVYVRSIDELEETIKGFGDGEFRAFIDHLTEIGFLCRPREGFIKLAGHEDLRCMKEYLDEGKYPAPRWFAFPRLSIWSMEWRMGIGENYAMNLGIPSKDYKEIFPSPKYWQYDFSQCPYGHDPPLGYFWNGDGKPKYPISKEGLEINDFITMEDEKQFESDTFTFKSLKHALLLSKDLYFGKYHEEFSMRGEDEDEIWQTYEYSVLLNACYFKFMQDMELKEWLLETGDEPLVYISDDEENLLGRALMELRDEIRRICVNEDKIDWAYTEYLKVVPWM